MVNLMLRAFRLCSAMSLIVAAPFAVAAHDVIAAIDWALKDTTGCRH